MRNRFDQQLQTLKNGTAKMFSICENMLHEINDCMDHDFRNYDFVDEENRVFSMGKEIEKTGMEMLIRQQPVARDLRSISTSFKMVYNGRRIATMVMDIRDIYETIEDIGTLQEIPLSEMGELTERQLQQSVDCLVTEDPDLAMAINDDVIDGMFQEIKQHLIEKMKENPDKGGDYVNLLMIAKYFEKIGDHSVNIAENSYFAITGREMTR